MISQKIVAELRSQEFIKGVKVTREEFENYQEIKHQDLDYVIYKFIKKDEFGEDKTIYEKYLLEDLDEDSIDLMLTVQNAKSLKKIEKYVFLFYILTIFSLLIGGFVLIVTLINS